MEKYTFVIEACISMNTEVEASSLEEAVKMAKERGPLSLCHQCASGDSEEEWVTSGELDFDPSGAKLIDAYTDKRKTVLSRADKVWKR